MIKRLLQNKAISYSITSAALVMMFALLGTKITGFIRQALYVKQFYGTELDIFYAANLLPEVIFNIIALGSINAALIPIMTKAISKEGNEKASYIFSSILNLGILLLTSFSIIFIIFAPSIVGWASDAGIISKFKQEELDLLISMIRLLFISPVLLGISSIIASILQIKRHFLITQLSPLVYNLSSILGLFIFVPFFGLYGLAYGVILGSILHLLIQIPAFKTTEIKYHFGFFEVKNQYTRNTGKLMGPRLFGLAADQILLIFQTGIALIYPKGALGAFRSALVIRDVPISVFGTTLSQAAFPTLTSTATDNDMTTFKKYFIKTFQQIVFLTLPIAIIILVLRLPIVRMTFGVLPGVFTWDGTKITALILFFMSLSILGAALISLISRAFYALSNTTIPVIVAIISIVLEIFLSVVLSSAFSYLPPDTEITNLFVIFTDHNFWDVFTKPNITGAGAVAGIAFATAISSIFQIIVLCILLSKKIRFLRKDFFVSLGKKFFSATLLGISSYLTLQISEIFINIDSITIEIGLIFFLSFTVGMIVYIYSEYLLKDDEFDLIRKMYDKIKGFVMRNKKVIKQAYKSYVIAQEEKQP